MASGSKVVIQPKLVVFDLDYTLWPFWVDTHVDPPFTKKSDGKVYDVHGRKVKHFPEVPKILERLKADGIQIGVASRTACTREANSLVALFDWDKYIDYKEIYPGTKTTHFSKFFKASGIKFRDMIFFDDEQRNINDLTKLGVLSILVDDDGVTEKLVQKAFKLFADQRQER